mmetsp:Transcript_73326/g.218871  ORF Transcript_73326/g.218871 Transcript_73326/m.218871 type:complete len:422 (-) Transcript_73326:1081-2346(-)
MAWWCRTPGRRRRRRRRRLWRQCPRGLGWRVPGLRGLRLLGRRGRLAARRGRLLRRLCGSCCRGFCSRTSSERGRSGRHPCLVLGSVRARRRRGGRDPGGALRRDAVAANERGPAAAAAAAAEASNRHYRLLLSSPGLHLGVGELPVVPPDDFLIAKPHSVQLVPTCDPVLVDIVGPAEELELLAIREHALNEVVDLIWLAGGLTNLTDDDIAVQVPVQFGVPLDTDEAVLLGVVDPVTSSAGANDSLQLVRLHPNDLLYPLVPPDAEAVACQLHGPAGDPQEDHPVLVDLAYLEVSNLVVGERPVGQLHVDVPRRVGHDDADEAVEYGQREDPQITLDPLRWKFHALHRELVDALRVGAAVVDSTLVQVLGLLHRQVESIVDILALVDVPAGVQIGAVSQGLVGPGLYDLLEVDLGASGG